MGIIFNGNILNNTVKVLNDQKKLVHIWCREPSSGILKKMESECGTLKKIYEHSYFPYTETIFIEQNIFHQVTEGEGQIISIETFLQ
jgi:hypothetical protein